MVYRLLYVILAIFYVAALFLFLIIGFFRWIFTGKSILQFSGHLLSKIQK